MFGEHLKREREMRGVSLEEISAATRISVRFLEALENERWEQLPGGIFNRGFIRSIARFLGLNEDNLIAEYAMETHERPEIAVWTKEPVRKRTNWFAVAGTIVILAALGAGGWYVHRAYGAQISVWYQKHAIVSTVMAKLRHKASANSSAGELPTPRNSAVAGSAESAGAVSARQSSSAGQAPAQNRGAAPSASAAAPNAAGSGTVAPTNGTSASGPMVLKVEAGETSNVTVVADGKTVFSGKLDAMKTLTLQAEKSFTVASSKSNAVLLELNGHTVPPLGPPNEPGKITLTRDSLKSNSGEGN